MKASKEPERVNKSNKLSASRISEPRSLPSLVPVNSPPSVTSKRAVPVIPPLTSAFATTALAETPAAILFEKISEN